MGEMPTNSTQGADLPATAARAGLGRFPLGSLQSRAAARLMLEQRRTSARRFELILCDEQIDTPSATEWEEIKTGGRGSTPEGEIETDALLTRRVHLPSGKPIEECLRKIGGYSEEEIRQAADECPSVPGFEIVMLWL